MAADIPTSPADHVPNEIPDTKLITTDPPIPPAEDGSKVIGAEGNLNVTGPPRGAHG